MNYTEDIYHPTSFENETDNYNNQINNEYDDTSFATYQSSVSYANDPVKNKHKKMLDEYKKMDKDYRKIMRIHNGKKVEIDLYLTSCVPGTAIRDALTGARYHDLLVGSRHEDNFFKMKMVNGELGKDIGHLYFETPKDCEKYSKTKLSDKTIKKWQDKYEKYCKYCEDMGFM
jgi:hypothetical protein